MNALIQEIQKIKSTTKELREFGFVVGGVILALSGISYWRHGAVLWGWPAAGAVLVVLGAVFPAVLKPLQKVWMGLALVMGAVMSRVIISLIFFVIVTPLALVLKAQGKKLLGRGADPGVASYWNLRGPESANPKRCEKQF
jgi:hypothetical protein